jgi:hypothetical protein
VARKLLVAFAVVAVIIPGALASATKLRVVDTSISDDWTADSITIYEPPAKWIGFAARTSRPGQRVELRVMLHLMCDGKDGNSYSRSTTTEYVRRTPTVIWRRVPPCKWGSHFSADRDFDAPGTITVQTLAKS